MRKVEYRQRLAAVLGLLCSLSCVSQSGQERARAPSLSELRQQEPSSPGVLGQLLLSELLSPGGDPKRAASARHALDAAFSSGKALASGAAPSSKPAQPEEMLDHLARALDDTFHGRLIQAPDEYLKAAAAARNSDDPDAALLAWFACEQAVALAKNTEGLFGHWQSWVEAAIADPQKLGFRARETLVGWWASEAWSSAKPDLEQTHADKSGCLQDLQLVGAFGGEAAADALRSFAPEHVQQWPSLWPEDPWNGRTPRRIDSQQRGCDVSAVEAVKSGVYYAEGYFEVAEPTQAIVAASNALRVWIDGVSVLERDPRSWSAWTNVGAGVLLPKGLHRVVVKLTGADTAVRILARDGRPLAIKASRGAAYSQSQAPTAGAFAPDVLRPYVKANGVGDPPSVWVRYVAAMLAHFDHEAEAGVLLFEPLVVKEGATGPALSAAAFLAEGDPLYGAEETRDLARDFHARALRRDPSLWESHLNRISTLAKNSGLVEGVKELRQLTEQFPEVPALLSALIDAYEELGWTPEYAAAVKHRADKFPEDPLALAAAAELLAHRGEQAAALKAFERVRHLNPDSDVFVAQALERRDFKAAVEEIKKLQKRRPQNRALKGRLQEVLLADGKAPDYKAELSEQLKRSPKDGKLRLTAADVEFAAGQADALPRFLADAVKDGANVEPLKSAVDLVEGMSELERYRLDTREVIDTFEKSGTSLAGNAARVLDYLAVWVHADGSSRMLEHEIVRLQSEEAIRHFAEQEFGEELILKARVIKPDGRILEPQMVKGKPTVTFPHLQVGDYVETERVLFKRAEAGGTAFEGPHWFFREKEVAYARSELLVVVPRDRTLEVDKAGGAPDPDVRDDGYFRVYHWRVDGSPAAPSEPLSVPAQEFLPQVTVNWGLTLERRLRMLENSTIDVTPVDPRIVRIVRGISGLAAAKTDLERAKAIYRWVHAEIREGEEADGRRAVVSRSGNRWRAFTTLCRAAGVQYRWGVARSRLNPDAHSAAQAAAQYSQTVIRVGSGPYAWVDLNDKFAPFGYLPSGNRGVNVYLLGGNAGEKTQTPSDGTRDSLRFNAQLNLDESGAADVVLEQEFVGKYGSVLRKGFSELEQKRVREVIETRVLGTNLPGAQLLNYEILDSEKYDQPLRIKMNASVAHFAVRQQKRLVITPPFSPRLAQLAALPSRQTPMLLATDQDFSISLKVNLPPGSTVTGLEHSRHSFGELSVEVDDRVQGRVLTLSRTVKLPAGRVSPEKYAEFQSFVRAAETSVGRDITVTLP